MHPCAQCGQTARGGFDRSPFLRGNNDSDNNDNSDSDNNDNSDNDDSDGGEGDYRGWGKEGYPRGEEGRGKKGGGD